MAPSSLPIIASEALSRDAAGLMAGRLVMLGFIAIVMLGIVSFMLYLRKMARNPSQEVRDLETLTTKVDKREDDRKF